MRKRSGAFATALVAILAVGDVLATPDLAKAQTSDPYISAFDDRPAARLRRERELQRRARPTVPKPAPRVDGAPEMMIIPPGSFMMGSPMHQQQRDRNEGPQVQVNIDYAFEIGRYEVTFDEWNECVKDGGCNGYKPSDNGWGRGRRPVTNISYNDAQSYIRWLNAKTGLKYRLPSEAEWEYVARAGQPLPFSTQAGRSISAQYANFNGEFPYGPNGQKGRYLRKTVPVGSYAANGFGVHDIHGNVYEFVSDCYVAGHAGNPADGSPRRDGNCEARIIRGGSWVTHGYQMRAAKRLRYTMDHRYDDFGFRLARTIGPMPDQPMPLMAMPQTQNPLMAAPRPQTPPARTPQAAPSQWSLQTQPSAQAVRPKPNPYLQNSDPNAPIQLNRPVRPAGVPPQPARNIPQQIPQTAPQPLPQKPLGPPPAIRR